MQQLIDKMALNPKRLFLLDGVGACLTAITMSAILAALNIYFGMPVTILNLLSAIAFVFAFYSISCFLFVKNTWRPFLRVISIANILYCCLTTLFVIKYFKELTTLGLTYFLLEIVVIAGLVFLELKVLNLSNPKTYNSN